MKYDFASQLEKDSEEYGVHQGSGGWFKIEEGNNKIRVLTSMVVIAQHYIGTKNIRTCYGKDKGCPFHQDDENPSRPKWMLRVLNYKTNQIELARLPYTIIEQISALQKNEEYAFDEVPMPYDITIVAKNAGTKEVEYSLVPARQNVLLDNEILVKLNNLQTVEDVVEKLKEKQRQIDGQNRNENQPAEQENTEEVMKEELSKDEALDPNQIPF